MVALLEHELARNQTSPPLVVFPAVFPAVGIDVFLRNAVDHGPDLDPDGRPGAHRARLMRRVEHEVRQVAAIAAGDILQGFQFDVLDARSGRFHSVSSIGDHDLPPMRHPGDDGAYRVVAAIAGKSRLGDRQLHELLLRLVG